VEFATLAERSVGSATNLTAQEIERVVGADPRNKPLPQHWRSDSEICLPFPGAESLVQSGQRVAQHLEKCAKELARTQLHDCLKLVIGHGGSFRHAALALGVLQKDEVGMLSMEHCRPVLLEYLPSGSWTHLSGSWKQRRHQHAID
jgi:2,3-bisphosphoglycerate-dependent phosphoglycerate mutase